MKKFEILVELKKEVLDPQGRAIKETLGRLGIEGISEVKVARRFYVEVDETKTNPEQAVELISREYLANPVSEVFTIKRID